jgi:prepilin-type N-terminal cleavage/methylation domain-containing protein
MAKGFTIIELLVVIFIIGLLIAIITPTLAKARFTSREIVCRNNLRQIATGIQMYVDERKDFPDAFGRECSVPELNLSYKLSSFISAPSGSVEQRIMPWACPNDKILYWYGEGGGSYLYAPYFMRRNYVLPMIKMYEQVPNLQLMQDFFIVENGTINVVRTDTSVINVKNYYAIDMYWVQQYLRR